MGKIQADNCRTSTKISEIFKASGLKVARQKYEYNAAGIDYCGENVYSILQAPRGDATEAIVLVAAWKNMDGELNQSGVALVLTLARYFKRKSLSQIGLFGGILMYTRVVSLVERYNISDHCGQ